MRFLIYIDNQIYLKQIDACSIMYQCNKMHYFFYSCLILMHKIKLYIKNILSYVAQIFLSKKCIRHDNDNDKLSIRKTCYNSKIYILFIYYFIF